MEHDGSLLDANPTIQVEQIDLDISVNVSTAPSLEDKKAISEPLAIGLDELAILGRRVSFWNFSQ